jgi:hypothetical protein
VKGGIAGGQPSCQLNLHFRPSVAQRQFDLEFSDHFEMLHFCEQLCGMCPLIDIKDEGDTLDDPDVLRFGVLKPNKVGVKKKRMLTLLLKQRVIRSFNRKKDFKDIHFESVYHCYDPSIHQK